MNSSTQTYNNRTTGPGFQPGDLFWNITILILTNAVLNNKNILVFWVNEFFFLSLFCSSKDTNLPENYLELIVDICNQVYSKLLNSCLDSFMT